MMAFLGGGGFGFGGFGGGGGACYDNDGGSGRAFLLRGGGGNRGSRNGRHGGISGRRPIVASTAHFSVERRGASSFTTSPSSPSSAGASAGEVVERGRKPIPIVLLAGFLGSGKTSTLRHLLENSDDVRIGTIVNDVAAVNIDAKLILSGVVGNYGSGNIGDGGGGGGGGMTTTAAATRTPTGRGWSSFRTDAPAAPSRTSFSRAS